MDLLVVLTGTLRRHHRKPDESRRCGWRFESRDGHPDVRGPVPYVGDRRRHQQTGHLAQLPSRTWLFLGFGGLATGLSWLCYFRAGQLGLASRVEPMDKLSATFVIVLSAAIHGEGLTAQEVIGGLLIVAGAIVTAR